MNYLELLKNNKVEVDKTPIFSKIKTDEAQRKLDKLRNLFCQKQK